MYVFPLSKKDATDSHAPPDISYTPYMLPVVDAFTPFEVLYVYKLIFPSGKAVLSLVIPAYPVLNLYDP
ncbi:hypothetical protein D3C73_1417210 [compost metagenome]